MILADKILMLRKRSGWSQEELAEKLNVSRQSISKWEGAASIPDISKILELAQLFGVTTDYLLKDDMEQTEYTAEDETTRGERISMQRADEFLKSKAAQGRQIGIGALLCVLSPVLLIVLAGFSQTGRISEKLAVGIGMVVLLCVVAAAVGIFIISGIKFKPYQSLFKGEFTLEYGVEGAVKQRQQAHTGRYTAKIVTGVALCILSVIPLVLAALIGASDMTLVCLTGLLLAIVSAAVYLFVTAVSVQSGFDLLLREGEFDRDEMEQTRRASKFSGVYWPLVTAGYLAWSFITGDWNITWVVWPVAALIFGGISAAFRKNP